MKKFISSINNLLGMGWKRAEASCFVDRDSLAFYRIIWGLFLLLFSTPYSSWIASVPQSLYDPHIFSIAYLFSDFPPKSLFVFADFFSLALIMMIISGVRARICSWIFLLTYLFIKSFSYSFGKIDHNSALLFAVTACMSFTNWGSLYAIFPDPPLSEKISHRSLAVAGVFIAFGFLTAGIPKALFWIDFDPGESGFLHWFTSGYFGIGRKYIAAPFVADIPTYLFELADYFAVLFELSGFIALLSGKRVWITWLITASLFHIANVALLNIVFNEHIPVYILFVSYSRHFWRLRRLGLFFRICTKEKEAISPWYGITALIAIFCLQIILRLYELPFGLTGLLIAWDLVPENLLKLYLSVALWVAALPLLLLECKDSGRKDPGRTRLL